MYLIRKMDNVLENGVAKVKNKLKPIDAPVYGYWSALYRSFYSRRLYVDVGKRWKGLGIVYLLLVIAVLAIPLSVRMGLEFNKTYNEQLIEPLTQIPVFQIQNGDVQFDHPMPYLIKNDKNQVIIIIDSTGKINNFTPEYPDLKILITKTTLYFKIPTPSLFSMQEGMGQAVPLAQSFGKEMNVVFDGKRIASEDGVSSIKYFTYLLIYPIVIAILYSIFLTMLLVIAFLGQVFSRIFFSFEISFLKSSRLLMVASTPMLLVLIIDLAVDWFFAGFGIILIALLTAYYSFALYSLRAESKQMVA